jgi:hypothetical protein
MLIKQAILLRIRAGEVDLAFRRWRRARVRKNTRLRTSVGLVEIVSITPASIDAITAEDALRAGFSTREELVNLLRSKRGRTFRIELRFAGEDPRIALRRQSSLTPDDLEELQIRLDRTDVRSGEPWTRATLQLIAQQPGVRAADLAARLGSETRPFKARVRRLKELGLTESLEVGYRLSPRGRVFLRRTSRDRSS